MPKKESDANDRLSVLRRRVAKAPQEPGVYRFFDEEGTVIYVGKAKDLRSRLRSYVQVALDKSLGPWKLALIARIADFETTVASSELEALVLETNLIKELKPKYNVLMKDDKNYVYVRVTLQEDFPRIDVVRKMENDGAKYFGPKTSAEQVRRTLTFLRKIFPYRTCKMEIEVDSGQRTDDRGQMTEDRGQRTEDSDERIPLQVVCKNRDRPTPCLDFHIGQCSAPCIGNISPEKYREECIDGVLQFLRGDHDAVATLLSERMKTAAKDKKFEMAARLRDQIATLENIREKQLVSDTSGEDADFLGVAVLSGRAHVVILQERDGKVIGENSYTLQGGADDETAVLNQFVAQYYSDASDIPDAIILSREVSDVPVLEQWLSQKRGKNVKLKIPERGKRSKLLELATRNALEKAKQTEAKWEADARNAVDALSQLHELLQLPTAPKRIEGYDISHMGGTETVGSMVVMKNGKPANPLYRSFTIRSLKSGDIDDYRSLQEVLKRRLRHLNPTQEEDRWNANGITFGKALKKEQEKILEIIHANPENLSDEDVRYEDFYVARKGEEVIAICRIFEHPTGLDELRSVCVVEEMRGSRLGQFLIGRMLKTVKKGKVYVVIDPRLESYYAEVGFRYVIKVPPVLQEKVDKISQESPDLTPAIALVYDAIQHKVDVSLSEPPDLLVIDGGKGQLSSVVEVLNEAGLAIPVIGLAKREEEIFVPGSSFPLTVPQDSPAKFLLMRLRDEAHRFANRHREKRGMKAALRSGLDDVPGFGPETKKALLTKFGSMEAIRAASEEALQEVLNENQLEALRHFLAANPS